MQIIKLPCIIILLKQVIIYSEKTTNVCPSSCFFLWNNILTSSILCWSNSIWLHSSPTFHYYPSRSIHHVWKKYPIVSEAAIVSVFKTCSYTLSANHSYTSYTNVIYSPYNLLNIPDHSHLLNSLFIISLSPIIWKVICYTF